MIKRFIPIVFSVWLLHTQAQIKLDYTQYQIHKEGTILINAAAGGMNCPQFSEIDLNMDGIMDLVVLDRGFYSSLKTFVRLEETYRHAPIYQQAFPLIRNWMLLRDFDGDGNQDLFTFVPGGVKVFRNTISENGYLSFNLEIPILLSQDFSPIYVAPTDIPSISDLDGDGDLDILSFNVIGNRVVYYKNISQEQHNQKGLIFEVQSECWGYFAEDDNNNQLSLFDTCQAKQIKSNFDSRHAGSTLLAIEMNNSGLNDLILGDITFNSLSQLKNNGSIEEASITEVIMDFPSETNAVDLSVFPAAYQIDVDNDRNYDLLIAPNNPNTSINTENVWYYRNVGSNQSPVFQYMKNNFLSETMIDLGERTYAVWLDENIDGKMDIIIGSYGFFLGPGVYQAQLALFRNISENDTSLAFEWVSDDYSELSQFNFNGIFPAFGDLDGDLDQDMIVAEESGKIHFFENTASSGQPAQFELKQFDYFNMQAGQAPRPFLVDLNRDGLTDLLVGERGGLIRYFENKGDPGEAVFTSTPSLSELGNIDIRPECCTGFSSPFVNEDSLGNYQLFVGSEQGYIYRYTNIEGNISGDFNLSDSIYLHASRVHYAAADFSEVLRYIITSEFAGGIQLWKENNRPVLYIDEQEDNKDKLLIWPNPTRNNLKIQVVDQEFIDKIIIYSLKGEMVFNIHPKLRSNQFLFPLKGKLDPGIYIIQIQTDLFIYNERLVFMP
jgi:hypothetical protein